MRSRAAREGFHERFLQPLELVRLLHPGQPAADQYVPAEAPLVVHEPDLPEPMVREESAAGGKSAFRPYLESRFPVRLMFVRRNPETAREVCRRGDTVAALDDSLFRILLTHMMVVFLVEERSNKHGGGGGT